MVRRAVVHYYISPISNMHMNSSKEVGKDKLVQEWTENNNNNKNNNNYHY